MSSVVCHNHGCWVPVGSSLVDKRKRLPCQQGGDDDPQVTKIMRPSIPDLPEVRNSDYVRLDCKQITTSDWDINSFRP